MRALIKFRQNLDADLPASHLIDIAFEPCGIGIAEMPGILVKQVEMTRGKPLAGLAVKAGCDAFMVGLSREDASKNISLLEESGWIDIPIVLSDSRRGILTIEKGQAGTAALKTAIATWVAPQPPANLCERLPAPKLGMSKTEAEQTCWGKPLRLQRSTTSDGVIETAFYKRGLLLFKNGVLAEIVENE